MGEGTPYSCDPLLSCITTLTYTNSQTPSIVASLAGSTFDRCEMAYLYDCYGSVTWYNGNNYADWIGNDGVSYNWEDSIDCGSSVGRPSNQCECDQNDPVWRKMEATLTSGTYGWAAFPPSQFRNGDLGGSEYGHLTLGALRCHIAQ